MDLSPRVNHTSLIKYLVKFSLSTCCGAMNTICFLSQKELSRIVCGDVSGWFANINHSTHNTTRHWSVYNSDGRPRSAKSDKHKHTCPSDSGSRYILTSTSNPLVNSQKYDSPVNEAPKQTLLARGKNYLVYNLLVCISWGRPFLNNVTAESPQFDILRYNNKVAILRLNFI